MLVWFYVRKADIKYQKIFNSEYSAETRQRYILTLILNVRISQTKRSLTLELEWKASFNALLPKESQFVRYSFLASPKDALDFQILASTESTARVSMMQTIFTILRRKHISYRVYSRLDQPKWPHNSTGVVNDLIWQVRRQKINRF